MWVEVNCVTGFLNIVENNFYYFIDLLILTYNLQYYFLSVEYEPLTVIRCFLYSKFIFLFLKHCINLQLFLHLMYVSYDCGIVRPNSYELAACHILYNLVYRVLCKRKSFTGVFSISYSIFRCTCICVNNKINLWFIYGT